MQRGTWELSLAWLPLYALGTGYVWMEVQMETETAILISQRDLSCGPFPSRHQEWLDFVQVGAIHP